MNNTGSVPETTSKSVLEFPERPAVNFGNGCSQADSVSDDSNCIIKQEVLRDLSMDGTQGENVFHISTSNISQKLVCSDTDSEYKGLQSHAIGPPNCAGDAMKSVKNLREAENYMDGMDLRAATEDAGDAMVSLKKIRETTEHAEDCFMDSSKDLTVTTEDGHGQSGHLTTAGIQQVCDSLSSDRVDRQWQTETMLCSQEDTESAKRSPDIVGLSLAGYPPEVDKTEDMAVSRYNASHLVEDSQQASTQPQDLIPAIVIDMSQQTSSQLQQDPAEFDDTHLGICGWKDHPISTNNHQHHHHHLHDAAGAGEPVDAMDEDKCYSTEDETSDWEAPVDVELDITPAAPNQRPSKASWSTVKALTRWIPMAHSKLQWTQLAGHKDSFLAGPQGTVFKLLTSAEEEKNLQLLMEERETKPYVPEYYATVTKEGKNYIQLQDLLHGFTSPYCVMDIKMGVRTYQEEELTKARKKPTLRKDLYQKMVSIDPKAPTEEEKRDQAILKPRYLKFRDDMSSTTSLGFRIEGTKTGTGSTKDYKDTRTREEVKEAVSAFVANNTTALKKYVSTLQEIHKAQKSSKFFTSHEIVGSSLLFVHDASGRAGVWMIDFAKCSRLPSNITITHSSSWVPGNYEDGYWLGMDNITSLFQDLLTSRQKNNL